MPFFEISHTDQPVDGLAPSASQMQTTERVALWFAFSLTALFVVAELSPPGPLVLIAGLNFAFASLAWVTVLHRLWRTGHPPLPKKGLIWTTLGVGAVALATGALLGRQSTAWQIGLGSVLRLGGVLVLYVGLGLAIVRVRSWLQVPPGPAPDGWRRYVDPRWVVRNPAILAGVLVGQVVLVVLGLWVLGGRTAWPVAVLLGLGVLPFPAVLSLLSEHALRAASAQESQHGWGRVRVLALGTVIVAATVVFLTTRTRYDEPIVLGLLAFAAVVVAIVTATLADVAVVLLVLALLGVSAPTTPGVADPWPGDQHVIVALGDSYMSGEGAKAFIDGTNTAGVDECRRARTAWPVLVSKQAPFDGLAFLACSGAKAENLRDPGKGAMDPQPSAQWPGEGTQLATYRSHFGAIVKHPAVVVLSIGGNDAGFSTIGATCIAPGSCGDPSAPDLSSDSNMKRVANRLRQAYAEVRGTFPDTPVVVVPYPDPLYVDEAHPADGAPCSQAPLSSGDVAFIARLLKKLDSTIEGVTEDYGFYYADTMQAALADEHLQLCDPQNHGHAGLNFISARAVGGISGDRFNPNSWKHGSLHPNELGHAALARAFESWLQARGAGDLTAGLKTLQPASNDAAAALVAPRSETSVKGAKGDSSLDCVSVGPDECNARANAWALNQLGNLVLKYLWCVALLLVGAWLIGFAAAARKQA